jgi:hypothetical protein
VSAAQPGPLAEEAARLMEAIGDWTRSTIGDVSTSVVGGGAECQVCPFCQLVAVLRRTQPETFAHLADASASMIAALRTVVERHDHGGPGRAGVERIDLDDRDPESDPGPDVHTDSAAADVAT